MHSVPSSSRRIFGSRQLSPFGTGMIGPSTSGLKVMPPSVLYSIIWPRVPTLLERPFFIFEPSAV